MPTSGRKKLPEKKEPAKKRPEKKYQTAGYQRDFAKVILTGPAYSIPEAKALLDRVLKGG